MSADSPGTAGAALRARGLHVTYRTRSRTVRALSDVDLTIVPGQGVGIVGVSGSGKSTLLHVLLHLLRPDAGTVTLDGAPVTSRAALRDYRRAVQFVPQDPLASLDPRRTLGAQIRDPLVRLRVGGDHSAAVSGALARVGLEADIAGARIDRVSGGQAQRAAIARAIVTRPRYLLADEPVSALDAPLRAQVLDVLADLRAQGMGIGLVTHDLASAHVACEDVVVLDAGRVVEAGPFADVVADPHHERTRRLWEAIPRV